MENFSCSFVINLLWLLTRSKCFNLQPLLVILDILIFNIKTIFPSNELFSLLLLHST